MSELKRALWCAIANRWGGGGGSDDRASSSSSSCETATEVTVIAVVGCGARVGHVEEEEGALVYAMTGRSISSSSAGE